MDRLLRDMKFAFRSLVHDKSFVATTLLTLAICIGANVTMFAIVHSVLLRPLPVPDSGSILLMSNEYPKAGVETDGQRAAGDYYDGLRDLTVFSEQAMYSGGALTIDIHDTPTRLRTMNATPSLFRLLRVPPLLGRTFTDEEGEIGHADEAILSYSLWEQLYAGDRTVLGRTIRMSGRPFTIVGVMPRDFTFIDPEVRLWIPLAFTAEQKTQHHNNNWMHVGRLKPGASIQQAQTQVDAINRANLAALPELRQLLIDAGFHSRVELLQDRLVKDVKTSLHLLWGGALFLILIAAVNLAGVGVVHVNSRTKDFATRLALGANRVHMISQLIVEQLLLSTSGAVAGIGLGFAILKLASRSGLDRFPRASEVSIDVTVILYSIGLAVLVGLLTGLVPVKSLFSVSIGLALRDGSRTETRGRSSRILRHTMVVVQVGCAFVLLVGAGLMLTSFRNLLRVNPGFNRDNVLTVSTSLPRSIYKDDAAVRAFSDRALEAIRTLPGVIAAGLTDTIPFSGRNSNSVIFPEGYTPVPGESVVSPSQVRVSPGYFEAMNMTIVRGRAFDETDRESTRAVIIVDERLARRFWPDRDPIGRRMFQPQKTTDILKTDDKTQWLTVVGVVKPVRLHDLSGSGNSAGAYYFPLRQSPQNNFSFAIRTARDPGLIASAVRMQIAQIDPALAVFDVRSMTDWADLSLASRKTAMLLASGFGVIALFLAAIGIYGLLAYLVSIRRREIGIRIALGSTESGIARMVLGESLMLVAVGLVVGVAGAIGVRSAITRQIYGVQPLDPWVLGGVIAILAAVAIVACLVPARRAMLVDPVHVLRA
jgi:predicted permease